MKTAEQIVREEFKRNYEDYIPRKPKTSQTLASKKKVGIHSIFICFSIVQDFSSPETMIATTRRAHHQALMKKNSRMSSTVISHPAVSRELKIQSSGGTKIKQVIHVCRVWQRIFLLSQVSF